jgi:general secretion pathway protein D
LLWGCATPDNGLSKKDYQDLSRRSFPEAPKNSGAEPPIPALQPIIAAPLPPSLEQRLVSIDVSDDTVPLREVLLELARKAEIDVDIDSAIEGGIIFRAQNRPFAQVMDRIAELCNLRYTFHDNVLKVEVDRMYHHTYQLDAINVARTAASSVATNTNVFESVSGGSGGGGGNNASTSTVDSKSIADLWVEVSQNIGQILYNSDPKNQPVSSNVVPKPGASAAGPAPSASGRPAAAPPVPAPVPTPVPAAPAAPGAIPATPGSIPATPGAAAIPVPTPSPIDPSAVAGASGAGAASAAPVAAVAQQMTPTQLAQQSSFSVNKQAGMVSVFGNSRQQRLVKSYINAVSDRVSSQVLIEAKIVEVNLTDEYKSGINWFSSKTLGTNGNQVGIGSPLGQATSTLPTLASGAVSSANLANDFTTLFWKGKDLSAMLNFVKDFGTTRTLSSPRITVMNNQTAVLKVAENQVYFTITVQTTPGSTGVAATTTYSSTLHTVPIGLVMTVQPSINTEKEEVTLSLRPTVSRIVANVDDPAVLLVNAAIHSQVPVVEVREMDSVVTVGSGEIVIMGGLMQERTKNQSNGVPGVMDVPVIGNLAKATDDLSNVVELVIFLKATMVRGSNSVHDGDKDLYKRYIHDPRPLAF